MCILPECQAARFHVLQRVIEPLEKTSVYGFATTEENFSAVSLLVCTV